MNCTLLNTFYFGTAVAILVGLAQQFFAVPHAIDRWGKVLLLLPLALLGYYDYAAWSDLPDVSRDSVYLEVNESLGVGAFAICAATLMGTELFDKKNRFALTAFRFAILCFGLYAATATAYWIGLYVIDKNGDLGLFVAMSGSRRWASFAGNPGTGTILTVALFLPSAVVAVLLAGRPRRFWPYRSNGIWNAAFWLSVVPFFYGMFGPVVGWVRWLFPFLLITHLVILLSAARSRIRSRMAPP